MSHEVPPGALTLTFVCFPAGAKDDEFLKQFRRAEGKGGKLIKQFRRAGGKGVKGMVLQGRRGAVITALDIVSPTSNYVESCREEASHQTELHLCCWSPSWI